MDTWVLEKGGQPCLVLRALEFLFLSRQHFSKPVGPRSDVSTRWRRWGIAETLAVS